MRKEDILAYVNRDWAAVEKMKRERMAERANSLTAAEKLAIGDDLRRHLYSLHPDWPTEEHRREDFDMHVRLSESLRLVHANRRS